MSECTESTESTESTMLPNLSSLNRLSSSSAPNELPTYKFKDSYGATIVSLEMRLGNVVALVGVSI